ncbi:MAG: hypothetical protein RBT75_19430, partial [Anaerolineae bacterium]|nr:hypothetical protein [Anaerolineae bacterium]
EFAARLKRRLNVTAVLFGGALYGLFYPLAGLLLLLFTLSPFHLLIAWIDFLYLYPRALLFSRPAPYLATSLGALALALLALWLGKPTKLTRWLLILIIAGVLLYPFIASYQPAVEASAGYTLYNATQPPFLLGPVKSAQAGAEIHRCRYTLLGWEGDTLYYQESCESAPPSAWRTTPHARRGTRAGAVPGNLSRTAAAPDELALQSKIPFKILEDAGILRSPSGQWLAFVVQHSFGPEDVLIISTSPAP